MGLVTDTPPPRDLLALVLSELAAALEPLEAIVSAPGGGTALLRTLGYAPPPGAVDLAAAVTAVPSLLAAAEAIAAIAPEEKDELGVVVPLYAALGAELAAVAQNIEAAAAGVPAGSEYLAATRLPETLPSRLLHFLVVERVSRAAPRLYGALVLLGVFELVPVSADPATFTVAHVQRTIRLDRLQRLMAGDVVEVLQRYGWDAETTAAGELPKVDAFLAHVRALMEQATRHVQVRSLPRRIEESLLGAIVPKDARPAMQVVAGFRKSLAASPQEIGLTLFSVRNSASPDVMEGVAVAPFGRGGVGLEIPLGAGGRWALRVKGELGAHGGVVLVARPNSGIEVRTGPQATNLEGAVGIELRRSDDAEPLVQLPGGSSLYARELYLALGATLPTGSPRIGGGLQGGRLVLRLGGADAFVGSAFGAKPVEIPFDLGVTWSPGQGFTVSGGAGIAITIGLHKEFGPVALTEARVGVGAGGDGVQAIASVSGRITLGPITATVDQVGAEVTVTDGEGAWPIAVVAGFKPPSGVGLAIDAGVVVGGGYLFFDRDRAEYAGVLQLEIGEIAVGAVGLLTTRMPDGSDGFSLLLIITAEFAPVQLGFGFTLNGLGGLLGVNRTVVVDVLREGLRARTLDSVMFPEDPVRNAPQIVSDLRRVFPPVPDQYVLGPMAILGWGTPPLLRAELGVVLELPSPLRLVVMGQLAAAFPSFEVDPKLVDLKMDVLGVLDFGRKEASLDAALYDSRVSVYALEGEMAMRMRWGGDPSFALAVGGMHPRFQPPPGFPSLKRVSVALGKGNNPRLRLEGYLALTSNSVQVGARLDLYAKAGRASVRGELSFDALFEFDPFRFEVAIRARVTVKAFGASVGVGLRLTLSGPTPWRAKGRVSIEICWVDVSVGFNVTIGPGRQPALPPPADVWTLLATALADARAWSAELPGQGQRLATLREVPGDGALAVHPLGTLAVRQRVVPLDTALETYGGAPVGSERRFSVTDYKLGSGDFQSVRDVQHLDDYFAPSQFFEMTDEEKVAAPSFEAMPAGLGGVGSDRLTTAWSTIVGPHPHTEKQYRLVTEVIDEDRLPHPPTSSGTPPQDYEQDEAGFHAAAAFGAAAHDPLRRTGRTRFQGIPLRLTLDDTAYAVADAQTLRRVTPDALPEGSVLRDRLGRRTARTYAGARAALRAHVREAPQDRDRYLVLADHELDG